MIEILRIESAMCLILIAEVLVFSILIIVGLLISWTRCKPSKPVGGARRSVGLEWFVRCLVIGRSGWRTEEAGVASVSFYLIADCRLQIAD